MSDLPADFDARAHLARIDRDLAEQAKLRAEATKFQAEWYKLRSEEEKLDAEARKLRRDTSLAPFLAGGAVAGGVVVVLQLLLRAVGWLP